ncbi:MAG: VWA domain-containing protein [Chitinophagaceae bacterium]|jgi:Ca-activated chloride channel family protein
MINDWLQHINFAYPWMLWLLLLVPLLALWYFFKPGNQQSSFKISSLAIYKKHSSGKTNLVHLPFVLRLITISLLILALARPQTKNEEERVEGEGIDIMLCMDVSGSMVEPAFNPLPLDIAKEVAVNFINNRKTDRIGIVTFESEAFTQCPLTLDHAVLISQIMSIRSGVLMQGTAIGSGLALSVERLRKSESKTKVVVLLTDGENNSGLIDPSTAKELAKYYKVRVYTIGFDLKSLARSQNIVADKLNDIGGKSFDESLLKDIAFQTGGAYYHATDGESLKDIYTQIDKLEKSKIETSRFAKYAEEFYWLVIAAALFLFIELWLRYKVLRKFP